MREVFVVSDNIISPLGSTTSQNFSNLSASVTAVKEHSNLQLSSVPFFASLFQDDSYMSSNVEPSSFTRFEHFLVSSIENALAGTHLNTSGNDTILIISSTKGNISLIEDGCTNDLSKNVSLYTSAKRIAAHFKFVNEPLVVSNACISGLMAILTGKRLIQSGAYKNAVVAGADVLSKFILSGFQSFQAVSNELCKPFDANRNGINLGEAAGTVILSCDEAFSNDIKVCSGAVSNDANHISGPSRTGEELNQAIQNSLDGAGLTASTIDFISAHGTATIFNDEMEAKAINLAGLQSVPVNSLKGYYGHTLGAAGIVESIISIQSLKKDTLIPTMGFSTPGVSQPVNVCSTLQTFPMNTCLKTASGFGGCNAALIFSKT